MSVATVFIQHYRSNKAPTLTSGSHENLEYAKIHATEIMNNSVDVVKVEVYELAACAEKVEAVQWN